MPSINLTPPTLESRVQSHLINGLHAQGWYVQKTIGQSRNGYPDVTAVSPAGMVWFIEVKQANGRLSAGQKKELQELRNHNANVAVLHGLHDVDIFIKENTHVDIPNLRQS